MSQINLHSFIEQSRANGPGMRAVVWVQGCPRHCAGCWNPDSLPFTIKNLITIDELESRITAIEGIDGVTFSGGEPFAQAEALAELAERLHARGLTIVCFTGYTLEQLQKSNRSQWNNLLSQVDLLIDGEYSESQKIVDTYRGSANQKLNFLSGRIQPEEVENKSQLFEFSLDSSGETTATGFPDIPSLDAVMEQLKFFLEVAQ